MPVFVACDELARLRQGRSAVLQGSEDLRAQLPDVRPEPSAARAAGAGVGRRAVARADRVDEVAAAHVSGPVRQAQGYFTPSSEGEFVGLYILFLQRIALAVVMNLPALYDERHLSKTVRPVARLAGTPTPCRRATLTASHVPAARRTVMWAP